MIKNFFSKILDLNQKELDKLAKFVDKVSSLEKETKKLKPQDFKKKTVEFKKRLKKGETLEQLLPESYALVREAAWRTIGLRPFDVQVMAAVALFQGKVAEQKTGEGKTLSASMPLYLRALAEKGAHLVTVNDYLARRDAGWNGKIYEFLGMSTGVIVQENKSFIYDPKFNDTSHGDDRLAHLKPSERKEVYAADITYGTNNEFGFDYLRDNMVQSLDQKVQSRRSGGTSGPEGQHYFAIIDEVDSVLIDEARTPLIISAPDTEPTDKYYKAASLIEKLNPDTDFTIDEKVKSATLTEHGITRVEKILGVDNLYEKDYDTIHHLENALRAKTLYLRDKNYVVKEDKVIIVDEFTGRLMFGRRWSDGLHQAVEAKEGVVIQQESKTLATISFQNYFRMYEVLAGMTATAVTEAEEFKKIYDLESVAIPTNEPMIRRDHSDIIYKTLRAKYGAVVAEIEEKRKHGQPVLVGTTSIENNEIVGKLLKRKKIPHNLLNAKNHEREAMIIAEAGKSGAVTVATNMAGRGVDIVLGGMQPDTPPGVERDKFKKTSQFRKWQEEHDKVIAAGGLHVIGTERHESRRIDNQLRGRSGRQGDPGSSRFFLSLEDDLMRIFGGEQISAIMDRLKLPEDQPIENKLISRSIEQAQVKVEGFNFDARKNLVEYDDIVNQQREIIYKLRQRVLQEKSVKEEILEKLKHQVDRILLESTEVSGVTKTDSGKINPEKVIVNLLEIIPFDDSSQKRLRKHIETTKDETRAKEILVKIIEDVHKTREKDMGEEVARKVEKFAYLSSIDKLWIDHIDQIDGLREGVRLRAYGQRDPLVEFKNEAYGLFENLLDRIDEELARKIFRIGVARVPEPSGMEASPGWKPTIPLEQARTNVDTTDTSGLMGTSSHGLGAEGGPPAFVGKSNQPITNHQSPITARKRKLGRNDPCWCGSGKKFKKCHYPQKSK